MEPIGGGFGNPRYSPNPNYEIGRGEVENNNESTGQRCDRTLGENGDRECNQYFTEHTDYWRHYADHEYHLFGYIGKMHALKKYDQFALNTSCFWGILPNLCNFTKFLLQK